ncbi:site-specific integrase [Bacteroidales bacterium AH-315-N07]|nr:site-specific integrase [Bacteroidales bacterium AH-315-N07]
MDKSLNFFLRHGAPSKNGFAPICLRFILDGRKADITLEKSLKPKKVLSQEQIKQLPPEERIKLYNWDEAAGKPTKGAEGKQALDTFLIDEIKRANDILRDFELRKKNITRALFVKAFKKKNNTHSLAYDYFLQEFKDRKPQYSEETARSYKSILTKLHEFAPNITLADIDYRFLKKYESYMLLSEVEGGKGNDKTTVNNNMKIIRTFVRIAIKNGDLLEAYDPFKEYKIERFKNKKRRSFCEPEEIRRLEAKNKNYVLPTKPIEHLSPEEWRERKDKGLLTPAEYKVNQQYLFGCYTGLRYRDVKDLNYRIIKNRMIKSKTLNKKVKKYYLDIDLHKTGENIIIPLIDKALQLIPDLNKTEGLVFDVSSNQKTNIRLKQVIKKAEIEKNITFHCSRHTFATLALCVYDIPEKVVQQVLGHEKIETTDIYMHLMDDYLFNEMDKLNKTDEDFGALLDQTNNKKQKPKKELIEKIQNLDSEKLKKLMKMIDIISA